MMKVDRLGQGDAGAPKTAGSGRRPGWGTACAVALLVLELLSPMPVQAGAFSIRTSVFDYDPTSGLLTKEVVEPTNPDMCVATVYGLDAYGHRTSATTRNCNGSIGLYPGASGINTEAAAPVNYYAAFTARSASDKYSADQRFVETTTNALGQSETRTYDSRFGSVTSLSGPNQLTTAWAYDDLGRKVLEKRADGNGTQWAYQYCTGTAGGILSCPTIAGAAGAYAITMTPVRGPIDLVAKTTGAANGPYVRVYYDALGREIRTETQGDDSVTASRLTYLDTEYNALGQVARKSRPYYSLDTAYWTSYTYDSLGRVTLETAPNGRTVKTTYAGLTVTTDVKISSTEMQRTVQVRNEAGQVAVVFDDKNGVLTRNYDPDGNLVRTTDAQGNITSLQYDIKGRKTVLYDPDMRVWSYAYNALGELRLQTDAKGQYTTLTYDTLGRLLTRSEPGLVSTWSYDKYADGTACAKGVGKLCEVSADNGYKRKHVYDTLGRPSAATSTIGSAYTASVGYDTDGRISTQTYPSGLSVTYGYSTLGYTKQLTDNRTPAAAALWSVSANRDAEGRLTKYGYGNGVTTTDAYYPGTSFLNTTQAGVGNAVQNLSHSYDLVGKLTSRIDVLTGVTASYGYDTLNRLTSETRSGGGLTGSQVIGWTYDAIGNLKTRTEGGVVNTYNYNSSGAGSVLPHAVMSVSGSVNGVALPTYSYDSNGNLASGAGRTVSWTSFNKVASITRGTTQLSYLYDAEHERAKETYTLNGTVQRTTVYLNPAAGAGLFYEEETSPTTGTRRKHYLSAGGQTIGMIVCTATPCTTAANTTIQYWHKDHLGSVSVVTSSTGVVTERMAYEPFGKRRNSNGITDLLGALTPVSTDRGYTEHEHMDEVGLVNMNGRIYDPGLGRFMSADPVVQSPRNLQSLNRYAYAWNSPVNGADPSGYNIFGDVMKFMDKATMITARASGSPVDIYLAKQATTGPYSYQIKGIGVAVGSSFCGPFAPACAAAGNYALAKAYGASDHDAFKSAAIAAATVQANTWIGDYTSGVGNVAAHAALGCAAADVSGGDCRSGAAAGAASAAWSNYGPQSGDPVLGFVENVVVGGTVSVIGGGKFANGAVTAAYAYLFNQLKHQRQDGWDARSGKGPNDRGQDAENLVRVDLEQRGFKFIDRQVIAIDGDYSRTYDLLMRAPDGRVFVVESKSTITGFFADNFRQVAMDVDLIRNGANVMTPSGRTYTVRNLIYQGVDFTNNGAAALSSWRTATIIRQYGGDVSIQRVGPKQ